MTKPKVGMRILRSSFLLAVLTLLLVIPSGNTTAATVSLYISNPVCVQALPATGACSIKLLSAAAYGSDTSFSQLKVSIDGKLRVNMQGFFDANAYLSADMLGDGLMVACGGPNASGDPNYGKIYTLNVTASMFDGSSSSGFASVRCPYYEGKVFLPSLRR